MPAADRPKFRTDLTWKRFPVDGVDTYTIRDELSGEYLKLDVMSGTIALAMDGTRTIDDLVQFALDAFPSVAFDRDYLVDLVEDLKKNKLIENPFARSALIEARVKKDRSDLSLASFKNLMSVDVGAVNPDKFLTRTYPAVRFMFAPFFVWLGIALFVASCYLLWTNQERVAHSAHGLFSHGIAGLALMWLAVSLVIVLHELGHGYAVKHYGGNVPRMGFLLMFFLPGMFCDTSDANLFPNPMHRVVVAVAGAYTELYSATLATLVWFVSPQDSLLAFLAYNVMMFSSVSGLIFNFNPLIKLDGYFVLSDWLDITDLQETSYRYLGYLFRRHVLRMRVECPVTGRRRKRILVVYGLLSLAYAVMFSTLIYLFLRGMLIQFLSIAGVVLSLFLLSTYVRRPLDAITRTARLWALDHGGFLRRNQAPIVALAALVLALFLLAPVPGRRGFVVRLEPARQEALLAPEDLTLAQALFSAGQRVTPGQPLVVLDADSVRTGAAEALARADAWRMEGVRARLDGSAVGAVDARARAASEEQALERVNRRVERAVLRAPFAGRVLTPSLRGLEGRMVEAGDTVCVVGDFSAVRASVVVTDSDLEDVVTGSAVRLRMRAAPARPLLGRIEAVEPVPVELDQPRLYRVWIALDHAPADARAGLTAQAWVRTPPRTAASHLKQAILRFVRLDLWV